MRNRVLALILALCLLAPVVAAAEGIQCTRQDSGMDVTSYPNVTLAANAPSTMLRSPEDYPMVFLQFPLPEGYAPVLFDNSSCALMQTAGSCVLQYQLLRKYSFESFLDGVEEDHVIKDGAEGVAITVNVDRGRAEALVEMKDFGSMAKLDILYSSDERTPTKDGLTAAIQAEIDRVLTSFTALAPGHYWSEGVYASVQLTEERTPVSVVIDTSALLVTGIEYNYSDRLDAFVPMGEGDTLDYEMELTDNSHVEYQREKDETAVYAYTAKSGRVYNVYLYKMDDGRVSSFYFDLPIYKAEGDDDTLYLSTNISGVLADQAAAEQVIEQTDALYAIEGANLL